ncbi:MAG: type VI secretion system-associated FHA domain protein TagH [Panacagrimonas sp.]
MITVEIMKIQGAAPPRRMSAQFGEAGGTLGRSPDCTLVLPDETRTVSRVHGEIKFQDGRYLLFDKGTNPVKVNGAPLGRGESTVVKAGDVVLIGPFELKVSEERSAIQPAKSPLPAPPSAMVVTPTPTPPPPPTLAAGNPFDDLFGPSSVKSDLSPSSADPFADLGFGSLDNGANAPSSPPPGKTKSSSALPDDFDPMAPPPRADALLPPAGADLPDDAFDALFSSPQAPGSGSLDALFGLSSNSSPDPFSSGALGKSAASGEGRERSGLTQWLGGIKQPTAAPVSDHVPEINAPFQLPSPPPRAAPAPPVQLPDDLDDLLGGPVAVPTAAAPPPAARLVVPAPPRSADESPSSDLIAALLDGLEAPELALDKLSPELMYKLGKLVREATQGTMGLLNARGTLKREMRANVTMIASVRNNPLKFSPDVEVALRHLIGPPSPGFMSAEDAMRDAYGDLRAHEFGFMAGVRAALTGVLKRFEPQQLEARLPKQTGLNALLAANRSAKLWELFSELYRQLAQEAEEDFQALFGREFLRAYEEHVRSVERDPKQTNR